MKCFARQSRGFQVIALFFLIINIQSCALDGKYNGHSPKKGTVGQEIRVIGYSEVRSKTVDLKAIDDPIRRINQILPTAIRKEVSILLKNPPIRIEKIEPPPSTKSAFFYGWSRGLTHYVGPWMKETNFGLNLNVEIVDLRNAHRKEWTWDPSKVIKGLAGRNSIDLLTIEDKVPSLAKDIAKKIVFGNVEKHPVVIWGCVVASKNDPEFIKIGYRMSIDLPQGIAEKANAASIGFEIVSLKTTEHLDLCIIDSKGSISPQFDLYPYVVSGVVTQSSNSDHYSVTLWIDSNYVKGGRYELGPFQVEKKFLKEIPNEFVNDVYEQLKEAIPIR